MSYGRARWLAACVVIGATGCVEVPEPTAVTDRGPPGSDGAADVALPEAGLPDTAPPDGAVDAAPDSTLDATADAMADAAVDGAVDAGPDVLPADAAPDMAVPEGFGECLEPFGRAARPDDPCVRVYLAGAADQRFAFAGSATIAPGTADQRVAVVGGLDYSEQPAPGMATVRLYDPAANAWVADGPVLPEGRWGHAVVRMTDGSLTVFGGSAQLAGDGFWEGASAVFRWSLGEPEWRRSDGALQPGRSDGAAVGIARIGAIYAGGTESRDAVPSTSLDVILDIGPVSPNPAMAVGRTGPAAVALDDGSVLVVGGIDRSGAAVTSVERFGGTAAQRVDVPSAPLGRAFGGAAALPDGGLFVGGIGVEDGAPTDAAFRYQSRYSRFVALPPLAVPRMRPTVSAIGPEGQGWRLIVGGESAAGEAGVVEIYDPHRDRFAAFVLPESVRRGRALHTASSFETDDGRAVLVAGGYDPALDPTDPAAYDPQALRFELDVPPTVAPRLGGCLIPAGEQPGAPCLRLWRGPALSAARTDVGAVAIPEGPVVVTGGLDTRAGRLHDTAESWLPGTSSWSPGPSLTAPRAGHTLLRLSNAIEPPLLALGGIANWVRGGYDGQTAVDYFDPGEAVWVESEYAFGEGRANAAVAVLDDEILVIGGQIGAPGAVLASVEQFDLDGILALPSLSVGRTRHTACVINSDDGPWVMVYGGYTAEGVTGSIERFTPGDANWLRLVEGGPPLGDSACIGGRERIDIFGGQAEPEGQPSDLWQWFDPLTEQIAEVARLAVPRSQPTVSAIGLAGSDEPAHLIVGGEAGGDDAIVELVFRNSGTRYAYTLPAGIGPRRGHRGVSHTWLAGILEQDDERVTPIRWRDVVIVGGYDPRTGAPLDEVLVFGLDVQTDGRGADGPQPDPMN